MRSGNPALGNSTFLDLGTGTVVRGDTGAMTLNGTVNKTAFLLVLTLVAAMYTWSRYFAGDGAALMPFVWGGMIGGLVLDFDFIEQGVEQGAPKYMEWYAAFGLLVTLVWLYLEILRLLAKLQSRD